TTGTSMSCASSTVRVIMKRGSGLTNPIAKITSETFSNCKGPHGVTFTATTSASPRNPWPLSGVRYAAGEVKGRLSNMKASISARGCRATLGGATASSAGYTTGEYANRVGAVICTGTGNLHIWDVSGCFGLINSGDSASVNLSYK